VKRKHRRAIVNRRELGLTVTIDKRAKEGKQSPGKERIHMSDLKQISEQRQKLYSTLYGKFQAGKYHIGDEIPNKGEVLWSYQSAARGLIYVIGGWRALPIEIAASEVQAKEQTAL
jgi:hypothetical protein